jgi:plastocyanin
VLFIGGTAFAASEPSNAAAQTIQVDMTNYAFTPNTLQLRANTPYRLRFSNASHTGHSFRAREFFATSSVTPADQSKIVDGEVEVDSGQTVEVNLMIPTPGTYKFHCSHFLHSAFGMTGEAVVR